MTPAERVEKVRAEGQELIEAMLSNDRGIDFREGVQRRMLGRALRIVFEYIDAKFEELEHGLDAVSDIMKIPDDD